MGFSLRRALAGAVMGAAHAGVELADASLKQAAVDRANAEQFERQKELERLRDEALFNRQQRVDDMKEAKVKSGRKEISDIVATKVAELRDEGVDPHSAKGLLQIGSYLGEKGFDDHGQKYIERGIMLQRNDEAHEDRVDARKARSEDLKLRLAEVGARRGEANDAKAERAKERDIARYLPAVRSVGAEMGYRGPDNKKVDFESGEQFAQTAYLEAIDAGLSPKKALEAVSKFGLASNTQFAQRPNEMRQIAAFNLEQLRATNYNQSPLAPPENSAATAVVPPAQPAAQPKRRTPGIFERLNNSDTFLPPK